MPTEEGLAASSVAQPLPPVLSEEWELQCQTEDVLAVKYRDQVAAAVLIRREHLPPREDLWEQFAAIQNTFPVFPLEDKVKALGRV